MPTYEQGQEFMRRIGQESLDRAKLVAKRKAELVARKEERAAPPPVDPRKEAIKAEFRKHQSASVTFLRTKRGRP